MLLKQRREAGITKRWGWRAAVMAAVGALFTSGCARSTVTTTVKADGSWTRTVAFHGPSTDKQGFGPGTKLEDVFAMPSGGPWTVTKDKKEDEIVYTATRQLHAGDIQKQDMAIKEKINGQNGIVMINEADVKETSPGVFTYREVLHWQGPKPKDLVDKDQLQLVKSALPPELATDANVAKTTEAISRTMGLLLLGPPDPLITHLFSEIMMNPDLAEHQLSVRMQEPVDKILVEQYGDKLTLAQRQAFLKKLASDIFTSSQSKLNAKTKPDPANNSLDDMNFVALTFNVKLPGKILSTNGEVDRLSNEAFWGVYPEAAAYGDIVLTASCQTTPKTAQR